MRRALLLLALPFLAAACGGAKTSAPGTPPAATTSAPPPAATTPTVTQGSTQPALPRCSAAGLTVSAKDGESGMGHRSTIYVLTNETQSPCSLEGFPGMAFLDDSGAVLRDTVARSDATPAAVVLRPGDAASYSLDWTEANGATCATSAKVVVTPPNDTNHAELLSQVVVCPGRALTVSPVTAGADG
jgi:hypothetical protein